MNNYVKYNTHNFASSYEEKAEPASSEVIAARSKAKAKPQPRESSGTTTISLNERVWIDIVPSRQDLNSHILSKKSDQSSSVQSESKSRTRWSSSILQD